MENSELLNRCFQAIGGYPMLIRQFENKSAHLLCLLLALASGEVGSLELPGKL